MAKKGSQSEGKSIMDIDTMNLDKEWEQQADRHYGYCIMAADARKDLADAKAELDVVEAEVSLKVRNMPEKYGVGGKLTEGIISSHVVRNIRYQEALKKVNDCKHAVDIADAAVSASEHRKKALESEVQLWSQGYFAKPKERAKK